jgi:hypothetical protein
MRTKFLCALLGVSIFLSTPGLIQARQTVSLSQDSSPQVSTSFPNNSISLPGVAPTPPPGFDLSGFIEIPYSPSLNFTGGAITIEAWVLRANTSRNETIFGNGWQESYWFGFSSTGKLRFTPDGYAHHADSSATIPAGDWTHVAIVFNNGTYNFFVNGALDSTTTQTGASLVAAPANSLMYIGYDRDPFTDNYYAGFLDEVRIWRSARSPSEIQQGVFTFAGNGAANLRAEWRMDGNVNDTTGAHNGILHGSGASFGNEGALPNNLHIPQVSAAMVLDGNCGSSEYAGSIGVTLLGTAVSLQHTANNLWICFTYLDDNNNSASVYLDPGFTREDPSQAVHNWFLVNQTNARTSYSGDGTGSYVITPTLDAQWDARYLISGGEFPVRSAEFRISSSYLGGWDHQIGLALGKTHSLINLPILDLWPALAEHNAPSTWSTAKLAGIGPLRTFSGTVKYVPKGPGNPETNVGGVPVSLIGFEPGGSEAVVDTTNAAFSGVYSLSTDDSFSNHRLEAGSPPRGMVYSSASSSSGGTSVDERTIDFGTVGGGTYPSNVFRLKDAVPYPLDTSFGPVYLIVAPQAALDAGALADFIDYKFRLGFTVVSKSLEDIDAQMPGPNAQDRIRAWEINQRNVYGSRLKYVLFVGSQDRIPSVKVLTGMTGYPGDDCAGVKNGSVSTRYSDWIYVDLISNFDFNGNGCYMDGIWNWDSTNWKPGYLPDLPPFFIKSVAIGRIPFNDPTVIRKVLANSANFERQSRAYKTGSLWGVSNVSLQGYRENGDDCDDWSERCEKKDSNANYDMSLLAQVIDLFILTPLFYNFAPFYQNTSPIAGGTGLTSPTQVSPAALTAALNAHEYGLVGLDGHGNSVGVYTVDWPGDLNHNGVMNLSSNPNLNEVTGGHLYTNNDLANLTPDNSHGAVWLIGACSTGDPGNASNFAGSILSTGAGVASAAALAVVGVGSWTGPDKTSSLAQQDSYFIAQRILTKDQRVGDAVWGDYAERLQMNVHGSGQIAQSLFGDPSLSYLGNPSAGTRLAAWSMNRREVNGQSYFNLPGPALPKKIWEFDTAAPTPASPRPSPVISAKNEVIVAAGNAVSVLRNGVLEQTLVLDAKAYGTPAVSSDGTIYVVDVNGKIYAFNYISDPYTNPRAPNLTRQRRWTFSSGQPPQTSPTIAPDGSILIATDLILNLSQLIILRPDGNLQKTVALIGKVQQAASASADRAMFVATEDSTLGAGYLYRLEPFCDATTENCNQPILPMNPGFSTAPLIAYGFLYVGVADGRVLQINPKTLNVIHAYNTHSRITVGPTSGPGGQVLVGTQSAHFYSLGQDMTLRWNRLIGDPASSMPAFSNDHLYLTAGDLLVALNPNSGQKVWQKYFPGTGNGSAAVGYGRQVIFQMSGGQVIAIGEGWVDPPTDISIIPSKIAARPSNDIHWTLPLSPAVVAPTVPAATALGILLQRSLDGADWQDVAILPSGTTDYTDTNVTADSSTQYRLQILDSSGQNSDFTISEPAQSLPSLPGNPSMTSVEGLSSTSLQIQWTLASGQVDQYRIERAQDMGGPFSQVTVVQGGSDHFIDTGLTPATSYFYQVTAINQTGESTPSLALGGSTWIQTLSGPTSITSALQNKYAKIVINWTGRTDGVTAVLEFQPFGSQDWLPLATLAADTYTYYPDGPGAYDFRVKFVQGQDESDYAYAIGSIVIPEIHSVFLPLINR